MSHPTHEQHEHHLKHAEHDHDLAVESPARQSPTMMANLAAQLGPAGPALLQKKLARRAAANRAAANTTHGHDLASHPALGVEPHKGHALDKDGARDVEIDVDAQGPVEIDIHLGSDRDPTGHAPSGGHPHQPHHPHGHKQGVNGTHHVAGAGAANAAAADVDEGGRSEGASAVDSSKVDAAGGGGPDLDETLPEPGMQATAGTEVEAKRDGDEMNVGGAASGEQGIEIDIHVDGQKGYDVEETIGANGSIAIELEPSSEGAETDAPAGHQKAAHYGHSHSTTPHPGHSHTKQPHAQQGAAQAGPGGSPAEHDRRLIAIMRKHGIVSPALTLKEARAAGLQLSLACAVLQQESSGGLNEFGSDPVKGGQVQGGMVTKQRYLHYKQLRKQGLGNQGVGPMQLTDPGLQDQADKLGGCWKPGVNMLVGMKNLRGLITQSKSTWRGLMRYNGSGPAAVNYANHVTAVAQQWNRWLQAAGQAQGPGRLAGGKSGGHGKHRHPHSGGGTKVASGGDPVAVARQFVKHPPLPANSSYLRKHLPHYTAAGGATNDCADFVSAVLMTAGRIGQHFIGVVAMKDFLLANHWHKVPKHQAQPGDVWLCDSGGIQHVTLVSQSGGGKVIGANGSSVEHITEESIDYSGQMWLHKS